MKKVQSYQPSALSDRQEAIVNFVREFTALHRYAPTIREIGEAAGISSTSVCSYNVEQLMRKGILVAHPGIARSIRILEPAPPRPATIDQAMQLAADVLLRVRPLLRGAPVLQNDTDQALKLLAHEGVKPGGSA